MTEFLWPGFAVQFDLRDIFESCRGIDALAAIVDRLRPPDDASTDEIEGRLQALIDELDASPQMRDRCAGAIRQALEGARLEYALASSGILPARSFLRELTSRLARRALPRRASDEIARRRILEIFDDHRDWRWITAVSLETWATLCSIIAESPRWIAPPTAVDDAINILVQRIGALGLDEELNAKLEDFSTVESPFLELSATSRRFIDSASPAERCDAFQSLQTTMRKCREAITELRRNKAEVGTNLRLTKVTRRLLQQLDRLQTLIHLAHGPSELEGVVCSARLFRNVIEGELTATSIRRLVAKNTDLVAYQVTEQGATKGQKYITDTTAGYWHFLRAALQGGAIVAPFAMIKWWLSGLPLSLGAQGLLYGLNYAVCFSILYLTGSILATKQPAVTASAIAQKIDEATSDDDAVEGVADVVILVWRSQFVSFVGNLAAALPLGVLLTYGLTQWRGETLVTHDEAQYLADSVHPFASGALFYAAVAGICLFVAGLISGAVDNQVIYADIRRRICEHPGLRLLGDTRSAIADFISNHLGMMTGNIALGFMLGIAGPLGIALGLPIDIRHIAFSSTEVGIAGYSLPEFAASLSGLIALVGVLGIGFMNFLICFVLTMGAGLDSRGIGFEQTGRLAAILMRRALTRPWEWFLPTSAPSYSLPDSIPRDR